MAAQIMFSRHEKLVDIIFADEFFLGTAGHISVKENKNEVRYNNFRNHYVPTDLPKHICQTQKYL